MRVPFEQLEQVMVAQLIIIVVDLFGSAFRPAFVLLGEEGTVGFCRG